MVPEVYKMNACMMSVLFTGVRCLVLQISPIDEQDTWVHPGSSQGDDTLLGGLDVFFGASAHKRKFQHKCSAFSTKSER